MTFLEVQDGLFWNRWQIPGMPEGKTEADYNERKKIIEEVIRVWYDNMAFAFSDDARIFIVHISNFEPCKEEQQEPSPPLKSGT